MAGAEPFPSLSMSADPVRLVKAGDHGPRRRRKSSGISSELRGDTGAPALATSLAHFQGAQGKDSSDGSSSPSSPSKRSSKRHKARSMIRRARTYALRHTWVAPLVLLAVFLSLYALNPTERNPIHYFIFLSYAVPKSADGPDDVPVQYGKGPWDVAFVAFYVIVLSFTREFIMQEVLRPLARRAGLRGRNKQARFMEQTYMALYTGTLGAVGMFVMSRTPVWYFNTRGMYEAYPHKTHEAVIKFYYLFQAAFWAQQAIVLLLGQEKPRKDFKELVGHHIISILLIALSYRFHFTYIGLAVYTTHDISDFFLASSKSLNYLDSSFTGPYFVLFMAVWIYLRHYLNLRILWSILTEFRTVGPYELDWETGQYKCLLSNLIAFFLLALLQALNLFWLFFIFRIAYRFVAGNDLKDDRSDEEGEPIENSQPQREKKLKDAPVLATGNGVVRAANGHPNGKPRRAE